MKVTRNDVAERAGVSTATVSYVINNSKYVSPELRLKVEQAIKELNYSPNMIAQSLVTKSSKHVGILLDNFENPYFLEVVAGMEEIASRNGYIVSICIINENTDESIKHIIQRRLDGILLWENIPRFSYEQLKKLNSNGVALINDYHFGSTIDFQYERAVDELITYLSNVGHKRIAYITGLPVEMRKNTRYDQYIKSLQENGIEPDKSIVAHGDSPYADTYQNGYIAMQKILCQKKLVTAVFCVNDLTALGAMKAIKEAGLRVPEDISVAGCDDLFLAQISDPPLTTLKPAKKDLGKKSMEMLLKQINGADPETIMLDVDLIFRKSTGRAKN